MFIIFCWTIKIYFQNAAVAYYQVGWPRFFSSPFGLHLTTLPDNNSGGKNIYHVSASMFNMLSHQSIHIEFCQLSFDPSSKEVPQEVWFKRVTQLPLSCGCDTIRTSLNVMCHDIKWCSDSHFRKYFYGLLLFLMYSKRKCVRPLEVKMWDFERSLRTSI